MFACLKDLSNNLYIPSGNKKSNAMMAGNTIDTIRSMEKIDIENFNKCVEFLNDIGIKTIFRTVQEGSFLPGLSIEEGCIVVNLNSLKFPGDILHEAGHIAVVPTDERNTLDADSIAIRPNNAAEEMMAIAWSYAACLHLKINPYFVFHDQGYKGGGNYIADNFKEKKYFGLPMLQWIGLTSDEQRANELGISPYPAMIKWLRD